MGVLCPSCFGVHYIMSFLVFPDEEERAGCFAFIVFWMSCYCKCPVPLPHDAGIGLQFVIVVFADHTHLHFHT